MAHDGHVAALEWGPKREGDLERARFGNCADGDDGLLLDTPALDLSDGCNSNMSRRLYDLVA